MKKYVDFYRYLAKVFAGLIELEKKPILDFLLELPKTPHCLVLVQLLNKLISQADEENSLKEGIEMILPSILELEKLDNVDNSDNSANVDNSDNSDNSDNIYKKKPLKKYGACKIDPDIFDFLIENLGASFDYKDIADLIGRYYEEVFKRGISHGSTLAYASCYKRYMVEEKLAIEDSSGQCVIKNKDTKETTELKKFGERVNGNGLTKSEPESEHKLEPESKTESKTEFEYFQERILQARIDNHWPKQVKIETIEETFKGTKTPEQVEKALARLCVRDKVRQFPPEPKDLIYAKENDKPKPKGYILFRANLDNIPI